jgi:preprotein translocase subunit YajC
MRNILIGGRPMDFTMVIMIVAMVGIFYFFMIRPESKKKKKLAEMRSSLAVGDKITTIGGLLGKVVSVDDDKITFETSEDRVRVQVAKWAVSNVGRETAEPPK